MHQPDDSTEQYSVELSPRVWARVGALNREGFNSLQSRATAVAELIGRLGFLDSEGDSLSGMQHRFLTDAGWVVYSADPLAHRLVVLDFEEPVPRPKED